MLRTAGAEKGSYCYGKDERTVELRKVRTGGAQQRQLNREIMQGTASKMRDNRPEDESASNGGRSATVI